jgi:O-antigen chain-terminating methyltransferase
MNFINKIKHWLYLSALNHPSPRLRAILEICDKNDEVAQKFKDISQKVGELERKYHGTIESQQPSSNFPFSWEFAADNLLKKAESRVQRRVTDLTIEEKRTLFYSFWSETCGDDYEEKREAQYNSYLPHLITGLPYPFVDIGCGAGEFVTFLNNNNIPAIGVDREEGEIGRSLSTNPKLKMIRADGLTFLKEGNDLLAGVSLLEVIEHMPPQDVNELIQVATGRLAPGGVLLIESLNARHPFFAQGFYSDPTHVRPVTDEYLVFLMQWLGLSKIVKIFTVPAPVSGIGPEDLGRIYWCYAVIGKKV